MTERRSRVGGWPIAIVGIILVLLAYELRYTLIPFVFAIVIGFVLDPVIAWSAQRLGGRRWPAAIVLTLAILGLVLGGGWWIGQQSFQEFQSAIERLPRMIEGTAEAIGSPGGITLFGVHYTPEQLSTTIVTGATNLFNATSIVLALRIGVGTLAAVVLTLVLIPYFLVSGPRIASGTIWLVPPERRGSIEAMLPVLVPVLRRYVVGLICVVIYTMVAIYIALGPLFHVPGGALLAVVVGFLELIPVIGPITSIVLIGLAAIQVGGFAAIFLMAWALVLRLSIDNLVGPFLLGRATAVHPVVVIFGFIVGAVLFGVIGLLLAVPVAASIRLILDHYYAEPIAPGGEAEPEAVRVLDSEAARPR
ncbi:MAG TPA: AI-2E family transporter [Acetobacteraceae bacterium]